MLVCPYDPQWKALFQKELEGLKQAFKGHPLTFHHIGSTSIPGCAAQPIIDIMGITNDVLEIEPFHQALEKLGYIALGEYGMKQRRFFQKRNRASVHLDIFEDSDPEAARRLRFRDYLHKHPEETKKYSQIKQSLCEKNVADSIQYILGKETFIKGIDHRAILEDKGDYWNKECLPRRSKWTEEELLNAMEANMQLQMSYFAKYLPEWIPVYEPDATVVMSTIPHATFNYVIGAKFDESLVSQRIEHLLNLFRTKNIPFSWWVSESDKPKTLVKELTKQGFTLKAKDVGMSLMLDGTLFKRKTKTFLIKRALDSEMLKHFASVATSVGEYARIYEDFFSKIPLALYGNGAPYEIYVGYYGTTPVMTGILLLHANVGGIYFIMTHPGYRKKGYATEMMSFLLNRIIEQGYHMAILQASPQGKPLYKRLGFQPKCHFFEYGLNPLK